MTTPKRFDDLDKENFDLVAKCIELIERIGWSDDGTYTFKDGDRWTRFEVNPKISPTFKVNEVEGYRLPPKPKEIDNE